MDHAESSVVPLANSPNLLSEEGAMSGTDNAQCRICHDEDIVANMEVPCACKGSLKYAHRRCVQKWCDHKANTICELCRQGYMPNYTATPRQLDNEQVVIDINDDDVSMISDPPVRVRRSSWPPILVTLDRQTNSAADEPEEPFATNCWFIRAIVILTVQFAFTRMALNYVPADKGFMGQVEVWMLHGTCFLISVFVATWTLYVAVTKYRLIRLRYMRLASRLLATSPEDLMVVGAQGGEGGPGLSAGLESQISPHEE